MLRLPMRSSPKPTRVPERTCIACGTKSMKSALIRLAPGPEGARFDPGGRLPGRGAYLCLRAACDKAELRSGRLSYALRIPVSQPEVVRLISELNEREGLRGPTETS